MWFVSPRSEGNNDFATGGTIEKDLMQKFSGSPLEMFASFWRNRNLIYTLSKRDVLWRYKGAYLGILWSFVSPLLMLIVYGFVFSEIFHSRWNSQGDSSVEFIMILFLGLFINNIFSECLSQAPRLVLNNVNYVKKVVFPLEVLPWVALFSALFQGLIGLSVWMLVYCYFYGAPHLTVLYMPLIMFSYCLMVMGFAWLLMGLGVYLRDISQFIGVFLTALMFLCPIFYPLSALPSPYQDALLINPMTVPVQLTRDFLFFGVTLEMVLDYLVYYTLAALAVASLGFFCFQKIRRGFADVL
jgi:lipopolysaccharide transport system permease protein